MTRRATSLGERLYAICAARGLRQADAARELGISPAHLSHLIVGRRQPSPALLVRLGEWCGTPVADLLAPAMDSGPRYQAVRIPPLTAKVRSVLGTLAGWAAWADDASLQVEDDAVTRARLAGEARAYRRAATALRAALSGDDQCRETPG